MLRVVRRSKSLVLLLLSLSVPARAELGGSMGSVESDRAHIGARMTSQPFGRYTRHELTRSNGGIVRELTNPQGQVFAVTWSGPGKPDLRAILGRFFTTFQASGSAPGRTAHALRRPAQVSQPDLRIQTEGHLGWFRGVALIPSLAPAGFSTDDLAGEP